MKNFSRFSILAVVLLALAGSAAAVELVTEATVTIVEGIEIVQVLAMNFGTLVRSPGTVDIATNGTFTDHTTPIVFDGTDQSVATFTVSSIIDQTVTLNVVAETMPLGLTLGSFVASWDGGGAEVVADGSTRVMAVADETLTLGAELVVGTEVDNGVHPLPYTVTVALP